MLHCCPSVLICPQVRYHPLQAGFHRERVLTELRALKELLFVPTSSLTDDSELLAALKPSTVGIWGAETINTCVFYCDSGKRENAKTLAMLRAWNAGDMSSS